MSCKYKYNDLSNKYYYICFMKQSINLIESAWQNRELLNNKATQECIKEIIYAVDKGKIRVAEKITHMGGERMG